VGKQEVTIRANSQEIAELLTRLNTKKKPAPEDVKALQKWLQTHPSTWRVAGDLAQHAADALIAHASGGHVIIEESLKAGRRAMLADLGYKEASALEQLLIEAVVLCWMRYTDTERRYESVIGEGLTLAQADWWERRLTAAQGRHLRACETLARVRKLLQRSPVQVNIAAAGGQQVNLSGLLNEEQKAQLQSIRRQAQDRGQGDSANQS
jgi:hypothetical protein